MKIFPNFARIFCCFSDAEMKCVRKTFFFFHTNLSVGLTQRVALKKRTMHLTERVGVTELVDVPLNGSIPFVVLEGESRQSPVSDG